HHSMQQSSNPWKAGGANGCRSESRVAGAKQRESGNGKVRIGAGKFRNGKAPRQQQHSRESTRRDESFLSHRGDGRTKHELSRRTNRSRNSRRWRPRRKRRQRGHNQEAVGRKARSCLSFRFHVSSGRLKGKEAPENSLRSQRPF